MTDRTCPLGDECDLTVAWMAGASDQADHMKQRITEQRERAEKAEAERDRLRDVMRTVISRAEWAKKMCEDGQPVSAYNVASGILGQIGSDVAAIKDTEDT